MSKINDSDKKLIKIFVSGFIGYILIVWFIVEYKILSITNSEGWLSFFGGLGGGIIAIMGVYITLSHNRYLIEESYNRQLTLMLNQITTQFWMEKATNIIIYLEKCKKEIVDYLEKYNALKGESVTGKFFDLNFINIKIEELNIQSQTIYPKMVEDKELREAFENFIAYLEEINNQINNNFNKNLYCKIEIDFINFDLEDYDYFLGCLLYYADPKEYR